MRLAVNVSVNERALKDSFSRRVSEQSLFLLITCTLQHFLYLKRSGRAFRGVEEQQGTGLTDGLGTSL